MPGDRYLGRINQFLGLDPMALRVYVLASGLQHPRRHGRKTKASSEALKMEQRAPFISGQGPVSNPPTQSSTREGEEWKNATPTLDPGYGHGGLNNRHAAGGNTGAEVGQHPAG